MTGTEPHTWRADLMDNITFIGLDVHKATVCVAVAESGRGREVRQIGAFEDRPEVLHRMITPLGKNGRRLNFCYEAGPCGYSLKRLLTGAGHECMVIAPSLIPIKAGDRVKTDRRDATMLAKLHRAGELTAIWVPDHAHEAMRDLVRARATAVRMLSKARHHLQAFLLRHGRVHQGSRAWNLAYRRWLTTVRFEHPAQPIVLQDYIHAVQDAETRRDRLTGQIEELLPSWSMAPVVAALQAMREVALVTAVTVVAEVGDFRRFANPRQLMAYLGLVPSEPGLVIRRFGTNNRDRALECGHERWVSDFGFSCLVTRACKGRRALRQFRPAGLFGHGDWCNGLVLSWLRLGRWKNHPIRLTAGWRG